MSTLLSRALVVMRSLSMKTHIYSFCVIAGTLLLCMGFFKQPNTDFSTTTTSVVKDMEKVSSSKLTLTVEVQSLSLNADSSDDIISLNELKLEDSEPVDDSYLSHGLTFDEYTTLTKIVEAEAGTEDLQGMTLIANVINNRVASDKFPNDIVSVIMAPGQFDPVDNGFINRVEPSHDAKEAVMNAFLDADVSGGALYFQKSPSTVWGDKHYLFRYGAHSFYE